MVAIHSWPDFDDLSRGLANLSENEAALHEAKDEAEARYFEAEAEAEAKKFGLEAVLASRT